MYGMGKPDPPEARRLREQVGKRLLAYREAIGKSQRQQAERLGITEQRYAKYEGGYNEMSYFVLERLTRVTEISLDFWLLGRKPTN